MATPENEKKTPVFDWLAGEFSVDMQGRTVNATEGAAAEQVIIKALQTARSRYLIYLDPENPDLDNKYGSDAQDILTRHDLTEAARVAELKRAITEALIYDPWITGVSDITIQRQGTSEAVATLTVSTIFDQEVTLEGVRI